MEKETRQQRIVNLIQAKRIATQSDLVEHLERAGFAATQSSVSRDLEELGVVKKRGRYTLPSASNGDATGGLLSLTAAGDGLVVARCEPGLASAVAVRIDRAALTEVAGTIAGEDTVFISVFERKQQRGAIKKIWALFAR